MNIQRFSSYRSSFKSLWKTLQQHAQSAMQLLPYPKVYRPLLVTGFFLPAELFVCVLGGCLQAYFAKLRISNAVCHGRTGQKIENLEISEIPLIYQCFSSLQQS